MKAGTRLNLGFAMSLKNSAWVLYVSPWTLRCVCRSLTQKLVAESLAQSSVALRNDHLWFYRWFLSCPRQRPQTFSPNCHSLPDSALRVDTPWNRKLCSAATAVTRPVSQSPAEVFEPTHIVACHLVRANAKYKLVWPVGCIKGRCHYYYGSALGNNKVPARKRVP